VNLVKNDQPDDLMQTIGVQASIASYEWLERQHLAKLRLPLNISERSRDKIPPS
jgi:hypothetical protein